eukprot:7378143-Prymnesium_polylepis.1
MPLTAPSSPRTGACVDSSSLAACATCKKPRAANFIARELRRLWVPVCASRISLLVQTSERSFFEVRLATDAPCLPHGRPAAPPACTRRDDEKR